MQNWNLKHWLTIDLILIGLLFLVTIQCFAVHQKLTVSFLDVGQGDAIFIQTPEHHNILIDAGAGAMVVDEMSKAMNFFDKTIDLFILTHPHRDHYGGILDVLQKYDIEKIMLTGVVTNDPMYGDFLHTIKAKNIDLIFVQNNQDLQIGSDLYLDFLYPFEGQSLVGQAVHNKNNTSIVARLLQRNSDGWTPLMLLTGDAEIEQEREILLSGQGVGSGILKLGHHGSKTATSDPFLAAVNPLTVVVSAGLDNKFEHPHAETIEKVKHLEVRNTMMEGLVEFIW
ncbi:MBL fold metallo-hydrolase [Candidatus Pacearchaeota archaeon]|nr:MBL fold metallo-hydrolase [Candidatus Pacearchaeota archaeon]